MVRYTTLVTALFLLFCVSLALAQRPDVYPFDVSMGGKLAKWVDGKTFAKVDGSVTNDTAMEIGVDKGQIVMNVFPCDSEGVLAEAQNVKPVVIMINNDNRGKLNNMILGEPLKDGFYLMNVVATGKTSRVMFEVKAKADKSKE